MVLTFDSAIRDLAAKLEISLSTLTWILIILLVWSAVWKGFALWKSAKRHEKWWFIALMIINTVGILEILYLYVFSKDRKVPDPKEME